jgi:hypothetical protein
MIQFMCEAHPGLPMGHDDCAAGGVSWSKVPLLTNPESFLDTGYERPAGEEPSVMDRILHDARLAHQLVKVVKALEDDHGDFLAFLASEMDRFPCLHGEAGQGSHASTPPMMYPELLHCIIRRARLDMVKKLQGLIAAEFPHEATKEEKPQ